MIKVYKHHSNAIIPTRANSTDAGGDLYSIKDIFIPLGRTVKIETGIAICIPPGFVGKLEDRSSLAAKGLKVSGGVIDALYQGDISVIMTNLSNDTEESVWGFYNPTPEKGYHIKAGDKIAQILLYQVNTESFEETKELWSSERGYKGLGSSGR